MKHKLFKRITAAVLSGLLTLGVSAHTAFAAGETGSITVHKFAVMGESTIPHDGTLIADDSALGTKLEGAGFSLFKVNDGVEVTSDSTADGFAASDLTIVGDEKITPADGVITWDGLEKGYYVLVETTPVDGFEQAASSIIKFPFAYNPSAANENSTVEPNWDVHVYPKNVANSDFSKVNSNSADGPFFVGDQVDWAIQGKIDATREIDSAYITDTISTMFDYKSSVVKLTGGVGAVELEAGVDYTTTPNPIPAGSNGDVTWTLTAAGIQKAVDSKSTGLVVDLQTIVNASAQDGSGTSGIVNEASYEFGYTTGDPSTGSDSETSAVGGVEVDKYVNNPEDKDDKTLKLAGAEFKLQYQNASGDWVFLTDDNGDDIVVTTDDNGFAQFLDFRNAELAADKMKDGAVDWTQDQVFKLQEVSAPEGYVLREAVLEVTIAENDKHVKFSFANQRVTDPPIDGDPNPTFQLPLTGGAGTVLFTVIGLLLMSGASFVLIRNRRKNA